MKQTIKNIDYRIDRINSLVILGIYSFLILFGVISIINPYWLISVSTINRKMEVADIVNNGIMLSRKGNEYEAIKKYDSALKILPNYSTAIVNKAISFKRQKKYSDAIKLLQYSLKLKEVDSSNVYSNLKDICFFTKDYSKAEYFLNSSLRTTKSNLDRSMKIGNYFFTKKKFDSAFVAYMSALNVRIKPETYYENEIYINYNKYNILKSVSNYDKSIFDERCFHLNLNMDKGLAENYNKIGLMYIVKNDLDSAKKYFYRALNISQDYFDALVNLKYVKSKNQLNVNSK